MTEAVYELGHIINASVRLNMYLNIVSTLIKQNIGAKPRMIYVHFHACNMSLIRNMSYLAERTVCAV